MLTIVAPSQVYRTQVHPFLQHVVLGGHATRGFVPRATVLVSVGQAADHVVLGSFRTCSLRPTLIEWKGMIEAEIKCERDQHHNEVDIRTIDILVRVRISSNLVLPMKLMSCM
jgi:hypothetical protein